MISFLAAAMMSRYEAMYAVELPKTFSVIPAVAGQAEKRRGRVDSSANFEHETGSTLLVVP